MFGRMAAPKHFNISSAELFHYWEANIAGAPRYPDGIKMMVGSFGDLFGTRLGHKVRKLAQPIGNAAALVPWHVARLQDLQLLTELSPQARVMMTSLAPPYNLY